MEIWEPEGVFGDSRLIWMIIEGMESGVWMVVSGTIVFGACGLVRGCECCTCYKLSILVARVSLAIFSRKNDNFSCIEDMDTYKSSTFRIKNFSKGTPAILAFTYSIFFFYIPHFE